MADLERRATLERLLLDQLEAAHDPAAPYDYLLMFSGGKDSSYLAHWLRQAPGGRVCLFSVDNGYQTDHSRATLRANANALGSDLYVYQPPARDFTSFYGAVLRESAALLPLTPQPLCTFCHAYLQGAALAFAERHGIPTVVQGLTLDQVTPGRSRATPRELATLTMFNRLFVERAHRAVTTLPSFVRHARLRPMAATLGHRPAGVQLVQPLWFLDCDGGAMRRLLVERYGWRSPVPVDAGAEYVASSCRLGELLDLLVARLGYGAELGKILAADHAPGAARATAAPASRRALRARQEALLVELGVGYLIA